MTSPREEPQDSQPQQRGLVEGVIASERELGEELEAAAAAGRVAMARGVLADLPVPRTSRSCPKTIERSQMTPFTLDPR